MPLRSACRAATFWILNFWCSGSGCSCYEAAASTGDSCSLVIIILNPVRARWRIVVEVLLSQLVLPFQIDLEERARLLIALRCVIFSCFSVSGSSTCIPWTSSSLTCATYCINLFPWIFFYSDFFFLASAKKATRVDMVYCFLEVLTSPQHHPWLSFSSWSYSWRRPATGAWEWPLPLP